MIQVAPHLPVTGLTRDSEKIPGALIAISDKTAQIRWTPTQTSELQHQIQSLIIGGEGNVTFTFKVASNGSGSFVFDVSSQNEIRDFLHTLRKSQHLGICANQDVEHSSRDNGFARIDLPVIALPELAWDDIDTSTQFLGRSFKAPILITGMTGGVAQGTLINERLAAAATAHNLPMGVGSQRMALENPAYADIFRVKRKFPKLFLIGNIGIGQLRSSSYLDLCERAVDMITADALAIHVNVLQELIQVEGDRDFRGIIDKIGHIKSKLKVPLLVKEVGVGMDVNSAKRLAEVGITCFDVGGAGGTSWAAIEGLRANDPLIQRRGEIFRNWGIPTAKAISDLRSTLPNATLVATGGIRDGLTVLKALHLGANMAGIGLPLMRAALESEDQASKLLASMIDELKIAKMCSGL
jgi:isopentenyl-diphosphate delta-isomerase